MESNKKQEQMDIREKELNSQLVEVKQAELIASSHDDYESVSLKNLIEVSTKKGFYNIQAYEIFKLIKIADLDKGYLDKTTGTNLTISERKMLVLDKLKQVKHKFHLMQNLLI